MYIYMYVYAHIHLIYMYTSYHIPWFVGSHPHCVFFFPGLNFLDASRGLASRLLFRRRSMGINQKSRGEMGFTGEFPGECAGI